MREDIITSRAGGQLNIDISKAIGKGYGHFWFTNNHCRYRFLKGSRNSKKSKVTGYEIVMKIVENPNRNVLVCRQNDVDNRQTTFENIVSAIFDLGFEKYFHITKMPLEITYNPTGQKIIFRGLNNPTALNSLTFAHGVLSDIYVEEAYEVTNYDDFRKLDGSLRGLPPKGITLQITCMFNAWSDNTWLYTEFFRGNLEDDKEFLDTHDYDDFKDENFIGPYGRGLYLHISTYKINEFRDAETYDAAMLEMKIKDPDRYWVEACGCWGVSTAACYPAFNENCIKSIQELLQKEYMVFALGVDTGFSTADGKRHSVGKGEDAAARVRSATALTLVGITNGYREVVVLDEYYHSNIKTYFSYNTDNDVHPRAMTQPELCAWMVQVIREWRDKYANYVGKPRYSQLFNGLIEVFVDSADVGSLQLLDLEARRQGLYNIRFSPGSKLSIQARVDFENTMQHYGNFLVCKENCPNTIREFKNARRGERGEARQDGDDHCITSLEYSESSYWTQLIQRHNFKPH